MKENSPPNAPPKPGQPWRSPWRWLVSLFLLWHLFGVIAPPLRAITYGRSPEPSPFTQALLQVVRPYMSALYLDHGYAFFAPEPGPLHLVKYKIEFADGRPAIEGRFPNLQEERPRLMYHRHFMIAEYLQAMYVSPTEPPKPVPPGDEVLNRMRVLTEQEAQYTRQLAEWQIQRSKYEQLRQSLIAHLESQHPGGKATITRVRHMLLSPPEFTFEQRKLDDPRTFVELPEDEGTQAPTPLQPMPPPRGPLRNPPPPLETLP